MSSEHKETNEHQEARGDTTNEGKEKEETVKKDMPLSECLEEVRQRVKAGRRLSCEIQPLYESAKEFQEEVGKSGEEGGSINITLPGSNYIGPGNPINAGEPKNTADKIALIHDWAYEFAETQEDVQEADLLAITLFEKEYKKSGNWQALVGDLGLRAKYFIEKKINQVLYPVLPSGTKKNDVDPASPPSQPDPVSGDNNNDKPQGRPDSKLTTAPEQHPPKTDPDSPKVGRSSLSSQQVRKKREAFNQENAHLLKGLTVNDSFCFSYLTGLWYLFLEATHGIARALVTAAESTIKPILEKTIKKSAHPEK